MAPVCLQVCVSCGDQMTGDAAGGESSAGRRLYDALLAASAGFSDITVTPVDCFAVCERPVTLAFRALEAETRWSYLVGGVDPDRDLADILAAARAVAGSPYGVPAIAERPPFFRRGVIARIPPLSEVP